MSPQTSPKQNPQISAATFPALRSFLRGYFHEDMVDEYGTLEEAARQFYEDADPEERRSVAGEWSRFLASTRGLPMSAINRLLTEKLGGACRLIPDDIDRISRALQGQPPPREEPEEEE